MYVALVADTGRFSYENTSPESHRMAAELMEAGVNPHLVYRRLYEDLPFRRLQLLQRALASVQRHDDGAMTLASLTGEEFGETDALETDSEGIVDHMRAVEGTAVAVLVRELLAQDRQGLRKVSLRATDGRVDVSPSLGRWSGGGHPQAAGFTTELSLDELVERLRDGGRLAALTGVRVVAKPAGVASHDVVASVRRSLPRGTRVGHAGTLDPFATGVLLVLVGRATRAQRWLMALSQDLSGRGPSGVDVGHGRSRRELDEHRPRAGLARTPDRLPHANPAGVLGGAGGRERAYRRARRGEEVAPAARPVTVHRAELRWQRVTGRASRSRSPPGRTCARCRRLDDAYCEELRAHGGG